MKIYCPYCCSEEEYNVVKKEVKEFKGEKINTYEIVGVCNKCGNELYINELEKENAKRIHDAYINKTGIITGKEIISFREKYNISQRELTSILNLGKMTINRYERGAIPTKSQSDYLKMIINNEDEFLKKAKEAFENNKVSQKTYYKILNPNDKLICDANDVVDYFKETMKNNFNNKPNIYNGYNSFDLDKTENVISYIADKVNNLTLTSLNKYLWYIDMLYYKNYCKSITGLTYMNYTHGPVIINHSYNELSYISNKYTREDTELSNGNIMSKIISNKNYDLSNIHKYEIDVINKVINKLKDLNVKEISQMSHEEDGWNKTKQNELISFKFATLLKNI